MDFLFELLEVLLLGLVLLLLDRGLGAVGSCDTFRKGLTLEASASVGLHGGSEALGGAWDLGARADRTSLVR